MGKNFDLSQESPVAALLADQDFEVWEHAIMRMIAECPLSWVPGLLIAAMKSSKARGAFALHGMSNIAKKIEED